MRNRGRRPFQNFTADNWLNLGLATILSLYVFYFTWQLALGRLCTQIGVDYCDFWSAATVAAGHGYASVYDLTLLKQTQDSILPGGIDPDSVPVVPFPFLPVFVVPFQAFRWMPLYPGFLLWSLLNIAGLWAYLKFFGGRLGNGGTPTRFVLMMLASLPGFLNIYTGQITLWLVVCVGEFMRAMLAGKTLRAGLWLGGLLIKPQLLILILPVLLLHRSLRTIAGFAVCAMAVGAASLTLVGTDGLARIVSLWGTYARGQSSNWIEGMINLRMLQFHLDTLSPASPNWLLTVAGSVAVILAVLLTWGRKRERQDPDFGVQMLGVFAGTTLVAWHSHIHMALVLAPAMLLLLQRGTLPRTGLVFWVFAGSVLFMLAVFAPPFLAALDMIPSASERFIYFFFAAAQLAANVYLLVWAVRWARGTRTIEATE